MSRRLVITGVAAAVVAGACVPALASFSGPVTISTSNGVAVGVHDGNTPVAAASVTPDGQACVGISLQLPVCTPAVVAAVEQLISVQPPHARQNLPVTVVHNDSGTGVGVRDVGVWISNDGTVCPVVSTQDWQCVGGTG